MTSSDAERWDSRYRDATAPTTPSAHPIIALATDAGAPPSTMLDIACGFGGDGLTMAQRGVDVTLLDVSAVALGHVKAHADALGVQVTTQVFDTTTDQLPAGPWDLVSCVHYLDRALLRDIGGLAASGGRVAVAIATTTNLERNDRPSARFLLEPDELPSLLTATHELTIIHHSETWRANGAHEAWVIAEA